MTPKKLVDYLIMGLSVVFLIYPFIYHLMNPEMTRMTVFLNHLHIWVGMIIMWGGYFLMKRWVKAEQDEKTKHGK